MIDHAPNALLGSVERITSYAPSDFDPTDAILCRVTAPLVSLAFGFIKRGVGVRILGREIGQGLVTLVKKMNASGVDDLEEKLIRWRERETDKLYARGHDSAAAAVEDRWSCLNVFIQQLPEGPDRSIAEIIRRIEDLFTNNHLGLLTLCTVHKAKGMEWERVFILDREKYMPSKWARQPWEHKQENNLLYVAITRAKLHLRYIESGKWAKPKTEGDNIHVQGQIAPEPEGRVHGPDNTNLNQRNVEEFRTGGSSMRRDDASTQERSPRTAQEFLDLI